jgi:hypothetical protein
MVNFPFHSNASKPGDLSLSPMQPSILCSILFDMLYSCPDHYLRSFPSHCFAHCLSIALLIAFPLLCSLPFHCFAHCLSIALLIAFPLQGIISCIWFSLLPIIVLHIYFPCSHSPSHCTHLTHYLTPTLSIKPVPYEYQ